MNEQDNSQNKMCEIKLPETASKIILQSDLPNSFKEFQEAKKLIDQEKAIIAIYPNKNLIIEKIERWGSYFLIRLTDPKRSWLYNLFANKRAMVKQKPGMHVTELHFPFDIQYTFDVNLLLTKYEEEHAKLSKNK